MSDPITQTIVEYIGLNFVLDGGDLAVDEPLLDGEREILDSAAMLEVILFLEEEFGIAVDDDDVTCEQFGSIGLMAAYVAAKMDTVRQIGAAGVR
jgi:acyl carrier protein